MGPAAKVLIIAMLGLMGVIATRLAFEAWFDPTSPQARGALDLPAWLWLIAGVACFGAAWWGSKSVPKQGE